ncbi:MAG: hypothetical protein COA86_04125 [Kangiella sp.]|nr:MAG: hypothetical protein COA86_04125 [Kangiella sp.]
MLKFLARVYFQLQILGLIFINPSSFFDRINQLNWYKRTHKQWFDELNLKKESNILEIGCATGTLTNYIAESGFIPTGLDSSNKMINFAKTKYSKLNFKVASALELPFENETFDSVIAASLLNIIPNKPLLLNEMFRTTKQGGNISVLVPSKKFEDGDLLLLQQTESTSDFSSAAMKAWHKKPPKMSAEEISILFEQAGFTEIRSKHYLHGMVISVTATKPTSIKSYSS